jgi:hypothetical protein
MAIETALLMRAFRSVYLRNHMKSLLCPRLLFFLFFLLSIENAMKRQSPLEHGGCFIAENDALQLALNCNASVIACAVKERSEKRYHIETQLGVTSLM